MESTVKKMRSPLKWHGGKSYLARRIVALMPEHSAYIEPFVGGGSVLLNKAKAGREVAGDLNAGLVEFWQYLAADGWILKALADGLPYDEAIFDLARAPIPGANAGQRAIRFLVRNRFSRGGLGKDFAWSDRLRGKRREGGPVPGELNAWDTIRAELPAIAERVRGVEFHCCDALQLIRSTDGPDTLIYCDPPYVPATRTVPKAYAHEMTREDHEDLLAVLLSCECNVMLSGYRNELYDDVLEHWRRVEFDMPNHAGQGKSKQRRTECLWMNFGS